MTLYFTARGDSGRGGEREGFQGRTQRLSGLHIDLEPFVGRTSSRHISSSFAVPCNVSLCPIVSSSCTVPLTRGKGQSKSAELKL